MTAPPLTFWQARALLLLTLESQSMNDMADRIAVRGAVLDLLHARQILNELTTLGLLEHTLKRGREGGCYWLRSGAAVEDALDQAYEVVKRGPLPQRQK